MKTRKFISIVSAFCLILSMLTGCGGGKSDVIKIGVMQFGEFDALQKAYAGFKDGLAEAGFKDGENIKINYLSAAADTANCPTIADTLINDKSDLILAIATPSVLCMKEKTSTIPVLFTAVTDPVASGIIASESAPGANISGTSDMNPVAEQIDYISKVLPDAKTVAVMYCSSESNSKVQFDMAKARLEANGLSCTEKTVASIDEVKSAVESLKGSIDAIYIPTDNTLSDGMTLVAAAANENGIPTFVAEPGMVSSGGFFSFGIDYYELGKLTAGMAVQVLKSDKPVDTISKLAVVHQTSGCEVAINKATAEILGITVPEDIASQAVWY